jgi:hypothetical protein
MGQPEIVELSSSASLAYRDDMVDGWCAGVGLPFFTLEAQIRRVEIDRKMADLATPPITLDERADDSMQRDLAHLRFVMRALAAFALSIGHRRLSRR